MLRRTSKYLRRRFRNSQRGQSILLLALGFIALAAFVGLVTDLSIMFVRFSTLRRAVDAASVAAAGQIREGTDYGTVALATRQYITLHGLQPHRVWVETCETDIAEWRQSNPEPGPSDPDFGKSINEVMPETELCNWDNPRKLVRVVAQIDSETTFLKLIGIDDFVITSSAVSETAVLDIALVLDNSSSMAFETTEIDYTAEGLDVPATGDQIRDGSKTIPGYCKWIDETDKSGGDNYKWGGCCNDPGAGAFVTLDDATGEWKIYTDGTFAGLDADDNPTFTGANGKFDAGEEGIKYNYHDFNYSDLICQPFRQVKDAARNFIRRLDFVRGDRVGLVTFNRQAKVQYPNDDQDQPAMMVSEEDAIRTLDTFVGVFSTVPEHYYDCKAYISIDDVNAKVGANLSDSDINDLAHGIRPFSYEMWAQCLNTNVGDGILFANGILTDVDTIRRDAVWVAIILSDGAANATRQKDGINYIDEVESDFTSATEINYGDYGFCPWFTFCQERPESDPFHANLGNGFTGLWRNYPYNATEKPDPVERDLLNNTLQADELFTQWNSDTWMNGLQAGVTLESPTGTGPQFYQYTASELDPTGNNRSKILYNEPGYPECRESIAQLSADGGDVTAVRAATIFADPRQFCNDQNPETRHFCLVWSNDDDENGLPPGSITPDHPCGRAGAYDADDYARDMADWAGLIEIAPNVGGNFIAMFSIGFGEDIKTNATAGPLLRYIADAGDNGVIDHNLEQDWRDNQIRNYPSGGYPSSFGDEFECYADPAIASDPTEWCGQYYYAENLAQLDKVFEAIAGRLFTRIAR